MTKGQLAVVKRAIQSVTNHLEYLQKIHQKETGRRYVISGPVDHNSTGGEVEDENDRFKPSWLQTPKTIAPLCPPRKNRR